MAQLKNTLVQGSLKATDSIYSNTGQFTIIKALTSASATTYGVGTNGQVLKSDGTKVYWGSDNNSTNYLALTGGTLSGDLGLQTSSNDSPDIIWKYGNGTEQARIWQGSGGTTKWAPLFREYNPSGTALYSGTLVLGDGTGASGTWNIISGTQYYLVTIGDQRSTATTPNTYSNKLIFHGLKTNEYIDNPSNNTYSYLLGLRGWSDSSGGNAHELAFNDTGLFWRQGSTTTWGNWYKILTSKTAVTIEQGGTGATTAAGARTNLGLGSIATETATNYLKWQATSEADSTKIYDFGVYVARGGADTSTSPSGNAYYNILHIPYRKANGNSKSDWGWSIANSASSDSRLFFRTSGADGYNNWQEVAHATVNTNGWGNATTPVYMSSIGVITACTYSLNKTVPSNAVFTDTLNTAGSTNTTSKIFLVGTTSQTSSAQTYSHTYVFETDGALSAKTLGVNYGTTANKVTMQWNNTDESLDFVFA